MQARPRAVTSLQHADHLPPLNALAGDHDRGNRLEARN